MARWPGYSPRSAATSGRIWALRESTSPAVGPRLDPPRQTVAWHHRVDVFLPSIRAVTLSPPCGKPGCGGAVGQLIWSSLDPGRCVVDPRFVVSYRRFPERPVHGHNQTKGWPEEESR